MVKRVLLTKVFALSMLFSFGQEIVSKGVFLQDSVKIGEEVAYALTVSYPADWQVILPDSTHNFFPFEYASRQYFPTRTDSTLAYDSVIYRVSTFEIDPVQSLAVPVYILERGDSITIDTPADSIILTQLVTVVPDSLELRSNVSYLPVDYDFNYTYWGIGAAVLLVIIIGVLLIFGKNIKSKIRLCRLKKEYEKFSRDFESGINKVRQSETNAGVIEDILVVWKKYMEKLEDKPFTKYTSKEISLAGYGTELKDVLQNIDRAIYSRPDDEQMHRNFESLEDFTQERYLKKVKEVQHG